MQLGPNMKRLREMDVADTVKACVIAGPADSVIWEVSACLDIDGMQLEGRRTRFRSRSGRGERDVGAHRGGIVQVAAALRRRFARVRRRGRSVLADR